MIAILYSYKKIIIESYLNIQLNFFYSAITSLNLIKKQTALDVSDGYIFT